MAAMTSRANQELSMQTIYSLYANYFCLLHDMAFLQSANKGISLKVQISDRTPQVRAQPAGLNLSQ
jgi:hypothetical protein